MIVAWMAARQDVEYDQQEPASAGFLLPVKGKL